MKTYLFEGKNLSPGEILDVLDSENCGVEEHHNFIKPFTEEELDKVEDDFVEQSKKLSSLRNELAAVSEPIKAKIKPLEKETSSLMQSINQGGTLVTEKVYCFPDYDNKIMGLYDSRGFQVGTRPMSRTERQLHINSELRRAI